MSTPDSVGSTKEPGGNGRDSEEKGESTKNAGASAAAAGTGNVSPSDPTPAAQFHAEMSEKFADFTVNTMDMLSKALPESIQRQPIADTKFTTFDPMTNEFVDQDARDDMKLQVVTTIFAGLTLFAARMRRDNLDFLPRSLRAGVVQTLLALLPELLPEDFHPNASLDDEGLTLDLLTKSVEDYPLYLTARMHRGLAARLNHLLHHKKPVINSAEMLRELVHDFTTIVQGAADFLATFVDMWAEAEEKANASVGQDDDDSVTQDKWYLELLRGLARAALPELAPRIMTSIADLRYGLKFLGVTEDQADRLDDAANRYRQQKKRAELPKVKRSELLRQKLENLSASMTGGVKAADTTDALMHSGNLFNKPARRFPDVPFVSRSDGLGNIVAAAASLEGNTTRSWAPLKQKGSSRDPGKLSSTAKVGSTRLTPATLADFSTIAGAGGGDDPGDDPSSSSSSDASSAASGDTSEDERKKKKKEEKKKQRRRKERRDAKEAKDRKKKLKMTTAGLNAAHDYVPPAGGHSYRDPNLLKEQEHLKTGCVGESFADELARTFQQSNAAGGGIYNEITKDSSQQLAEAKSMGDIDLSKIEVPDQISVLKSQLDKVTSALQPSALRAFGQGNTLDNASLGISLNDQYCKIEAPRLGKHRFSKSYKNDVFAVIGEAFSGSGPPTEECENYDYFEALHEVIDGELNSEGARMLVKVTSKGELRAALKSFPENTSFASIWRSLNVWFNKVPNFLALEQLRVDLKKTEPKNISYTVRRIIQTGKRCALAYPLANRMYQEIAMIRSDLEYLTFTHYPSQIDHVILYEARLGQTWADQRASARRAGVSDVNVLTYNYHPYLDLADILIRRIEMVFGQRVKQKAGMPDRKHAREGEGKGFLVGSADLPPNQIAAIASAVSKLNKGATAGDDPANRGASDPDHGHYDHLDNSGPASDAGDGLDEAGTSAASFLKNSADKAKSGPARGNSDSPTIICLLCSELHRYYECPYYPEGQRERVKYRRNCCGSYHASAVCRKPFKIDQGRK